MTAPFGEAPVDADRATLIMPTDHDPAPEVVRGWLAATVSDLAELARPHAVLVAGELLAHARRHGCAPYVLRLMLRHRTLVIAVDDCAAAPAGAGLDPGLVLVSALSRRWGVEQRRQARTVWAELALDGSGLGLDAPDQPLPRSTRWTSR